MTARLPSLLKEYFGYDSFRPLQREIMESLLSGKDTVAILPTGAGKSLCYQLPALARSGLTLVVSPLIALMKDQVDQLTAAGVPATFLNSTLDKAEMSERFRGVMAGRYNMLYLAPERLMQGTLVEWLMKCQVTTLAVDEAHCISEWGHDFRPEYRMLATLREKFPQAPVIALTATATPRVREDIIRQLHLDDPNVFVASFNRPNLSYRVVPKDSPSKQILEFAKRRPQESGIVYCLARKTTEAIAESLQRNGVDALPYHAGLEAEVRAANQESFLRDRTKIMCATIAFGMGINKPNVRWVIHADLPKNIEGYYQETGRAGRDSLPAECLLLYSRGDVAKMIDFIEEISDDQARQVARTQLNQMADFADSGECRRFSLLHYFGEHWEEDNCGNCDNCLEPKEIFDATTDAQKFLSCIFRVHRQSGFNVGINHLVDVLRGSSSEKLLKWGHQNISTYGAGKDRSKAEWLGIARQLVRLGYASLGGQFQTVHLTSNGINFLKSREQLLLTKTLTQSVATGGAATRADFKAGDIPCDDMLFQRLRELRKQLADERNVPPYVIFSDVTLRHIAQSYPETKEAMLAVPGVGAKKLTDFGEAFTQAVTTHLASNPRQTFRKTLATENPKPRPKKFEEPPMSRTVMETLLHYQMGKSMELIARIRSLELTTVEGHLATAVANGEKLDRRAFLTEEEDRAIEDVIVTLQDWNGFSTAPIFAALGGSISHGKLRLFLAYYRYARSVGQSGSTQV